MDNMNGRGEATALFERRPKPHKVISMLLSRRHCLPLVLLAGAYPALGQEEVRWRNLTFETVAGRKVIYPNGNFAEFHRSGMYRHHNSRRNRDNTGRWSLVQRLAGQAQSIRVDFDNGQSIIFGFMQRGDKIYFARSPDRVVEGNRVVEFQEIK
jgi:hypothetical protein